MQSNNIKWLDFFSVINTIMVTNEKEFNKFRDFLDNLGLSCLLRNEREFSDWQRLSKINGHDPNCIIFEYQPRKGMSFGYTKESSKEWYGEDPFTIDVLDSFYQNSKLIENNKNLDVDLEPEI